MRYLMALLLVAVALPVFAQQPQQIDPRIAQSYVEALQAEIKLRESLITAMREDQKKREDDLAAWFKAWFGESQVGQAEQK